jgi:Rrf2 family nitric oxide-sensitive transcriptional repressor
MKLTTFSDYTLRVLMFLALSRDRLATIPEIAAAYDISENHLMKVAHAPEDIRLGAIVRASEGNAPIVECLSDEAATCRIAPACRLAAVLSRAFEALYASLDEYTLADLVHSPRGLKALLLRR